VVGVVGDIAQCGLDFRRLKSICRTGSSGFAP
jgi:hypothetical protein